MHDHTHHHPHPRNTSLRILFFSIGILFLFALVEAVTGWWAHSLALLGDAGHMASDALALVMTAIALWISTKPASHRHSYGLGRAEVVAAWISSLLMLLISIVIIVAAVNRLHTHVAVKSLPMILIAGLGILVNLSIAWCLAQGENTLNIRAALLHVMGDLLASIAAVVAGAVIYVTAWMPIDPILSIFISLLIMVSSIRLLKESLLVLMEGVPTTICINEVSDTLTAIEGINALHDLHIWTLTSGIVMLSAHVSIREFSHWPSLLEVLKNTIKSRYGIDHITLQPEPEIVDCQPCNGRIL